MFSPWNVQNGKFIQENIQQKKNKNNRVAEVCCENHKHIKHTVRSLMLFFSNSITCNLLINKLCNIPSKAA